MTTPDIIMPNHEGLNLFNLANVAYTNSNNKNLCGLPLFLLFKDSEDYNVWSNIFNNLFYLLNINTNKYLFYTELISVFSLTNNKTKKLIDLFFFENNRVTIKANNQFLIWNKKLEQPLYILDILNLYNNFTTLQDNVTTIIYDNKNERFIRFGRSKKNYMLCFKRGVYLEFIKKHNMDIEREYVFKMEYINNNVVITKTLRTDEPNTKDPKNKENKKNKENIVDIEDELENKINATDTENEMENETNTTDIEDIESETDKYGSFLEPFLKPKDMFKRMCDLNMLQNDLRFQTISPTSTLDVEDYRDHLKELNPLVATINDVNVDETDV